MFCIASVLLRCALHDLHTILAPLRWRDVLTRWPAMIWQLGENRPTWAMAGVQISATAHGASAACTRSKRSCRLAVVFQLRERLNTALVPARKREHIVNAIICLLGLQSLDLPHCRQAGRPTHRPRIHCILPMAAKSLCRAHTALEAAIFWRMCARC